MRLKRSEVERAMRLYANTGYPRAARICEQALKADDAARRVLRDGMYPCVTTLADLRAALLEAT